MIFTLGRSRLSLDIPTVIECLAELRAVASFKTQSSDKIGAAMCSWWVYAQLRMICEITMHPVVYKWKVSSDRPPVIGRTPVVSLILILQPSRLTSSIRWYSLDMSLSTTNATPS